MDTEIEHAEDWSKVTVKHYNKRLVCYVSYDPKVTKYIIEAWVGTDEDGVGDQQETWYCDGIHQYDGITLKLNGMRTAVINDHFPTEGPRHAYLQMFRQLSASLQILLPSSRERWQKKQ
tara:strand:+ start:985 stop:1341 length:357 start_codon:yes stop_codon:yes gene_type:complete